LQLDKKLLCIDEISGILDHTDACTEVVEMDRNPRIALHPEIRQYALDLIKLSVPLPQLQQCCHDFAQDRFGDIAGNSHH